MLVLEPEWAVDVAAQRSGPAAQTNMNGDAKFQDFLTLSGLGSPSEDMPMEVAAQITAGLRRRFECPPIANLEAALGSPSGGGDGVEGQAWTADQARKLLFWPDDDEMRVYPRLLALPPAPHEASQDQPQVGYRALAPRS